MTPTDRTPNLGPLGGETRGGMVTTTPLGLLQPPKHEHWISVDPELRLNPFLLLCLWQRTLGSKTAMNPNGSILRVPPVFETEGPKQSPPQTHLHSPFKCGEAACLSVCMCPGGRVCWSSQATAKSFRVDLQPASSDHHDRYMGHYAVH